MKKIPTLFKREFEGHNIVNILPEVTPGFEWVLAGEGDATVKWDGSCCAIIDDKFMSDMTQRTASPYLKMRLSVRKNLIQLLDICLVGYPMMKTIRVRSGLGRPMPMRLL